MNTLALNKKKFSLDLRWVMIIASILILLFIQVFPMFNLIIKSFISGDTVSMNNYIEVYKSSSNRQALINTLVSSFFSMILSVIIAFPLAWLVGRTNLHFKKFFRTTFLVTYMIPPYVGAIAWTQLLNPRVGYLNTFLKDLFGLAASPFDIYTMGGMVFVMTLFFYPNAFISISRAMEKMDPSLEEASRVSGASPLKTVASITLPLMLPSIVSSAVMVFVSTASTFGIPSIVGGPGKINVLTTKIISLAGDKGGIPAAASLAVSLMFISNALLYISNLVLARKEYVTVSGKSTRPILVDLKKANTPITIALFVFSFITVLIPIASVIFSSLAKSLSKPLGFGNITFDLWKKVLFNADYGGVLLNSVFTAATAATVSVILSLFLGYLLIKTNIKGRKIPDFLITIGSATPSTVVALALIISMNGSFGFSLQGTYAIIIIAFIIKYQMMAMRPISASLSQIHKSLEESALSAGASWFQSFKDILIPLISPTIVAAWFLVFMPCFYELSMVAILGGPKTIGLLIYEYQTYGLPQTATVLASFVLIIVLGTNLILSKISKGAVSL